VSDLGPSTIQVAGDVTVDWAVLAPSTSVPALYASYRWEQPATVQLSPLPGSAAFIAELLSAVCNASGANGRIRVQGSALPAAALTDPADRRVTRSYAIWQRYPMSVGSAETVWRLNHFLGLQPAERDPGAQFAIEAPFDCLVIDDANLGFRDTPASWSSLLERCPRHGQIIAKLSTPLASSALWTQLIARHRDNLTVYCSVGDLRKEYAPIGQPLSWERTSSDVIEAVRNHPVLSQAMRVVVSLGLSGAVVVSSEEGGWLTFDPLRQEGDWEGAYPGSTPGLGTAVTAALALVAARDPRNPDWLGAVRRGLATGRLMHERGFTPGPDQLSFPAEVPVMLSEGDPGAFQCCEIPANPGWQIAASAFYGDERRAAEQIVLEGDEVACPNLPVERMGAWTSIDRTEIESMRSVRHIMREYLQQHHQKRPLSLAVFGPPGSGKSFAIKQMAKEWMADGFPIEVLEFNLSQFAADELPHALQRVRDCAVEQRLPMVFWDEFDTALEGRELGWLAQFLAPMQDGLFLEDGNSRPIGPAIFVFAGGTHAAMASFKDRSVELPAAKATDFLSRLRGFVDILGPNPAGVHDRSSVLRRSLLLRSLLKLKAPQLFVRNVVQIDPGVLRAFLDVTSYVHGARSMEAILDMSALSGRLRFERSALPPAHQLVLHVDAAEFLTLIRRASPGAG
jgi:hypothetical protein